MNRKEITESRAYQISNAALEHASHAKNVVEAFEAGAEWADKTMIEKVCQWLEDHIDTGLVIYHAKTWCKRNEFIKKLKQAMEE